MKIDGRQLADGIKNKLIKASANCRLKLAIVLVGDDRASRQFVARKEKIAKDLGVESVVWEFPADIKEDDLVEQIMVLNNDQTVSGIIVQLPLPENISTENILSLIEPTKDVDALSPSTKVSSPVVLAVEEIFQSVNYDLTNKKIAVIGQGRLVGRPISVWLAGQGQEVVVIDENIKNPESITKSMDVIISGVGRPGIIKSDMIKDGTFLIDIGTSEQKGSIVGDIDPTCFAKASFYTPVPGGVGPLVVMMVFKNLLELGCFS